MSRKIFCYRTFARHERCA